MIQDARNAGHADQCYERVRYVGGKILENQESMSASERAESQLEPFDRARRTGRTLLLLVPDPMHQFCMQGGGKGQPSPRQRRQAQGGGRTWVSVELDVLEAHLGEVPDALLGPLVPASESERREEKVEGRGSASSRRGPSARAVGALDDLVGGAVAPEHGELVGVGALHLLRECIVVSSSL